MTTTLRDWRHILAHGLSKGLGVPERGYLFPVFHYFVGRLTEMPCAVIQPGGPGGGDYTTQDDGSVDDSATWCSFNARFTIWLMVADPYTEEAADVLDDLVFRLHQGALDACRDDELNIHGVVPAVRGASQVFEITYGEREVLSTAVDVVVSVSTR